MKSNVLVDSIDHVSDEAIKKSATSLVDVGTVLVVARSGILIHTLPVCIAGVKLTFNQDIKALTPKSELDSNFLALYLRASESDILQRGVKKGATVHSITSGFLEHYKIPLPSLEVQRQIVNQLNKQLASAEKLVKSLQGQLALLEVMPSALLRRAFSGEL